MPTVDDRAQQIAERMVQILHPDTAPGAINAVVSIKTPDGVWYLRGESAGAYAGVRSAIVAACREYAPLVGPEDMTEPTMPTVDDRAQQIAERMVEYTAAIDGLSGVTTIHWTEHNAITVVPEPYASSVYEAVKHVIVAACREYASLVAGPDGPPAQPEMARNIARVTGSGIEIDRCKRQFGFGDAAGWAVDLVGAVNHAHRAATAALRADVERLTRELVIYKGAT